MSVQTAPATPAVTLHETDLFDVFCAALESGEFRQIRHQLTDGGNGRCVYGVGRTILKRAGFDEESFWNLHPRIAAISRHAGELLGYADIAHANDEGETFTLLAPVLRRARVDVEAGVVRAS
jgi:hypothetical protein